MTAPTTAELRTALAVIRHLAHEDDTSTRDALAAIRAAEDTDHVSSAMVALALAQMMPWVESWVDLDNDLENPR